MKVYLVEKVIGKKLEPIALKTNWALAFYLIGKDDEGLITEMIIDKEYPEGIGECQHWHFDPNELDSDGERRDEFHRKEKENAGVWSHLMRKLLITVIIVNLIFLISIILCTFT